MQGQSDELIWRPYQASDPPNDLRTKAFLRVLHDFSRHKSQQRLTGSIWSSIQLTFDKIKEGTHRNWFILILA